MRQILLRTIGLALIVTGLPLAGQAGIIPYPNAPALAPASSFYADAAGDIVVYFYGTDAAYDSQIGLLINGVSTGIFGLPNHSSVYGQSLVLGTANAGDILEFQLKVSTTGKSWYSTPARNSDGLNHIYSTPFATDGIIPDGWYVGFEDQRGRRADWDYNDHQFVVIYPAVDPPPPTTISNPEPSAIVTWSLLAGAGMFCMRRKRQSLERHAMQSL